VFQPTQVARSPIVILASVGHWLTEHPEYADWSVAAGTILLAVATFVLARQARSEAEEVTKQASISAKQVSISATQVGISQAALEAQVRPMLIDVPPGSDEQELVRYGPDCQRNVPRDDVHVAETENGLFLCSVPLRNAGGGLAIIKLAPWLTHPSYAGDLSGRLTTQLVPPGETTRALFAPPARLATPEDESLIVQLFYSDASGENTYWTKLIVMQRDRRWLVAQVQLGFGVAKDPMVTSATAV
jgi:hypothetical protein